MMRVVLVPISLDLMVDWFKEGNEIHAYCSEGLPQDAEFVGSAYDERTGIVYLKFHHPSFHDTEPGSPLERFSPTYIHWFPPPEIEPFKEWKEKEIDRISKELHEVIADNSFDIDG